MSLQCQENLDKPSRSASINDELIFYLANSGAMSLSIQWRGVFVVLTNSLHSFPFWGPAQIGADKEALEDGIRARGQRPEDQESLPSHRNFIVRLLGV